MASRTVTPLLSPDEDGDHHGTLHRPVRDDDSPRDVDETQSLLSPPDDPRGPVDDGNSVIKVVAAMFSFVVLGLYTSSIGVILPHLETHYGLTDGQVSFTFLAWPIGYVLAAQLNDVIHSKFGQRGIAIIGPLTHVIFALGASAQLPFILFLVFIAVGAFGAGLLDGSWCAWAGAMERASLVSGFLHGSFSVGAAAGPLLADALIVPGKRPWYTWYYVLLGAAVVEVVTLALAFRSEDATRYHDQKRRLREEEDEEDGDQESSSLGLAVLKQPVVWLCSLYLLTYVGTETSISGWIVIFMTRERHASTFIASLTSSGFWGGMAVGRLALGAVTDKFGVKLAVIFYTLLTIAFALLFGIIQNDTVAVVMLSGLGFFCGPLFPSSIVLLTQTLPSHLHVSAVSFVASMGQIGGTLMPFALGVIVDVVGMAAFQIIFLAQLATSLAVWIAYSRHATGAR